MSTKPTTVPEFVPTAPANDVYFKLRGADPPSNLYIQRDDVLGIEFFTQLAAGDTITVTARFLLAPPPGAPIGVTDAKELADFYERMPASVITVQQSFKGLLGGPTLFTIQLAEGFLLSVAITSSGAGQRGQTFVRCGIIRPSTTISPFFPAQLLFADYATQLTPACWPGGRIVGSNDGGGQLATTQVGNPAAGADWSFTTSLSALTRVRIVTATLTTSAAVANRTPVLTFKDGAGNTLLQISNNTNQTTGLAVTYQAAPIGTSIQETTNKFCMALPADLQIPAGGTIQMITGALDVADQWSNIFMQLETYCST